MPGDIPPIPPGKEHTLFDLPIRVDVATGARLEPSGLDPYALPWVQGAAATVPLRTRIKYAAQITDLREKLDVLRSRGTKDTDAPEFGPRLRTREFQLLDMGRMTVDWELPQ